MEPLQGGRVQVIGAPDPDGVPRVELRIGGATWCLSLGEAQQLGGQLQFVSWYLGQPTVPLCVHAQRPPTLEEIQRMAAMIQYVAEHWPHPEAVEDSEGGDG
jgi:hypothetical protein